MLHRNYLRFSNLWNRQTRSATHRGSLGEEVWESAYLGLWPVREGWPFGLALMNVCNRTQSSCVRTLKETMFEFGQIIQQWKTACWAVECSLLPALDPVCITHSTHQNTFPGQKASQGQTMSFISTRSPPTRIQTHLFCRLKWWCSAWPPLESPGEFQRHRILIQLG